MYKNLNDFSFTFRVEYKRPYGDNYAGSTHEAVRNALSHKVDGWSS